MQVNPAQAPNPVISPPPVVVGGPGIPTDGNPPQPAGVAPTTPSTPGPASTGATPAVAPAAPAAPAFGPIIVGDRIFNDHQEAIAFANSELQRRPAAPMHIIPAAPTPVDIDPSDLVFQDPKTALRMVKEQAKEEMRQESRQAATTNAIWRNFYENNPDLVGNEDLVALHQSKHWGAIKDMQVSQSLPFIAGEVRKHIQKIRQAAKPGEQLQPGPAIVPGASGPSAPALPQPQAQPTTFFDEVKALKKRKA